MKTIYSDLFIVGDKAIFFFIEHVDILFTQPLWLSFFAPLPLARIGSPAIPDQLHW